ncbi:hypothetical protein [Leclercia sp.]|uniref:hypothetical protein n=1 Tax=Leclercia sp. TaxID=1898428 RepID=UPI002FDEF7D5
MLKLLESSRILMPYSAPRIAPALFISPPILLTVIPLAPVDSTNAFCWLDNSSVCPSVMINIPSLTPVMFPLFIMLRTLPPETMTAGSVVEGVILTPSVMIYVSSFSKSSALSVEPLIVVSANTINGVNTSNADKDGKRLINDFVVLFNSRVLLFIATSVL